MFLLWVEWVPAHSGWDNAGIGQQQGGLGRRRLGGEPLGTRTPLLNVDLDGRRIPIVWERNLHALANVCLARIYRQVQLHVNASSV